MASWRPNQKEYGTRDINWRIKSSLDIVAVLIT